MACEQYSNGTNAEVTFTEQNLPTNFCPATWQDVLHQFLLSTTGNLPGTYSTFVISSTEPGPNDQDKVWLKLDSTATPSCRPVGFYLYYNGAWVRIDGNVFYGADDSTTVNTMTVDTLEPNVNWLDTVYGNQIFIVKCANANTGAATITLPISGVTGIAITKYGNLALEGYEMLPDMLAILVYTGTGFQLLNPRPDLEHPVGDLWNPSFEDDFNADNYPDKWVWGHSGGAVTRTGILDTTTHHHGAKSYKMQVYAPGGNQNGYETLTCLNYIKCNPNEVICVTWALSAEGADDGLDRPASVILHFYNAALALQGSTTIWTHQMDDLTQFPWGGNWAKFGGTCQAHAAARFFKIELRVGDTDAAGKTPKWIYWDDIRIGLPDFPNSVDFINAAVSEWTCPATKYSVRVRAWGGGGTPSPPAGGNEGGGGGGGYSESFINVIPATDYTVTVGAGGVSGVGTGDNGDDSSFEADVIAKGGSKGVGAVGGTGGVVGTGNIAIAGGDGGSAGALPEYKGGYSPNGGGNIGPFSAGTGANGNYPGGGGSGYTGTTGYNGANGRVIIEWF